jgi:hypothetical protein
MDFVDWWWGIKGMGFEYVAEMGEVDWGYFGGGAAQTEALAIFLLGKDLDGVLELCESCSFSINMLPSGFGTLSYCLSSCDSFLLLTKLLDLLLNSGQLFFFCSFVFKSFILLVFNLGLVELCILMGDLNWQRCLHRQLVRSTSVGLG